MHARTQVVSCEMIEAVGHEHLPAYFGAVAALLRPGGKAVIQVRRLIGCPPRVTVPCP